MFKKKAPIIIIDDSPGSVWNIKAFLCSKKGGSRGIQNMAHILNPSQNDNVSVNHHKYLSGLSLVPLCVLLNVC